MGPCSTELGAPVERDVWLKISAQFGLSELVQCRVERMNASRTGLTFSWPCKGNCISRVVLPDKNTCFAIRSCADHS
jgi:hypothetical protein